MTPLPKKRWNWPAIAFLLFCLIGSSAVSFYIFRYVAPSIPVELVGLWQVTEGPLKDSTLEFRWYGTATATQLKDGKKLTVDSTLEVEGDNIFMTTKGLAFGQEETVIQTIVELTEDKLVIRDQDQMTYRLRKLRN